MRFFGVIGSVALLVSCKGGSDKDSTAAAPCQSGTVTLTDANNYAFQGTLNVPSYETAAQTDIQICWDAVTTDIECHDLDPALDINTVDLVYFNSLSQSEVEAALSTNDLQQKDISGYLIASNDGGTCVNLSDFSFLGTPYDATSSYEANDTTYMLALTTGNTPGVGVRMLSFLAPSADSTVTSVSLEAGCGLLDYTADLSSLTQPGVCGSDPVTVDWSGLTVDGQGNGIDVTKIDSLLLGYYEGKTVTDLEDDFIDLEAMATKTWTLSLSGGTSANLSDATGDSGAFTGFTGDGIWVLGLQCSHCSDPAPLFVTVLSPNEEAP